MKLPKIQRPEVEVQFVGVKGFFAALLAICKVGFIMKAHINVQIKTFTVQAHGYEGGIVNIIYFYIIPKYKFKRVTEINKSEVEANAEISYSKNRSEDKAQ